MNKIKDLIIDKNLDAKMLLQIHDELIFEVDEQDAQMIAQEFEKVMEGIFELNIPLKVSLNIGNNWGELK
jgi:DNA polymerase-1